MELFGVDIGGSGIKGAPVNVDTGVVLAERERFPTPEGAAPDDVARTVRKLLETYQWKGPVGGGFPGVVLNGVVQTAANVHPDWVGVNIEELLTKETGLPFYVANDADVAGLAEVAFGAGKDQKGVVIVLTLGTGIGSAIFIDGILLPNTEFGHMEIRKKDAEHRASDAVRKRKELSWPEYAERLDEMLVRMENLFWPNLFILGGGGSKHFGEFSSYLNTRTRVVPATLLNQAGTVGAAIYAATRIRRGA